MCGIQSPEVCSSSPFETHQRALIITGELPIGNRLAEKSDIADRAAIYCADRMVTFLPLIGCRRRTSMIFHSPASRCQSSSQRVG